MVVEVRAVRPSVMGERWVEVTEKGKGDRHRVDWKNGTTRRLKVGLFSHEGT